MLKDKRVIFPTIALRLLTWEKCWPWSCDYGQ